MVVLESLPCVEKKDDPACNAIALTKISKQQEHGVEKQKAEVLKSQQNSKLTKYKPPISSPRTSGLFFKGPYG